MIYKNCQHTCQLYHASPAYHKKTNRAKHLTSQITLHWWPTYDYKQQKVDTQCNGQLVSHQWLLGGKSAASIQWQVASGPPVAATSGPLSIS